jgi:hypothetical protein
MRSPNLRQTHAPLHQTPTSMPSLLRNIRSFKIHTNLNTKPSSYRAAAVAHQVRLVAEERVYREENERCKEEARIAEWEEHMRSYDAAIRQHE